MNEKQSGKMLRPKDVQERLGVGKNRAYALIHQKGFPKITIGKSFYIPEDKFIEWIDKHVKTTIIV